MHHCLGQGAYLGGVAGKLGAAAALGQGGYPQAVPEKPVGYGDGATGYLGAMAGNGFGGDAGARALAEGYGNGYNDGYGAAMSTGGFGPVQGAYGAGAAQVPYGNAPVIPAGLDGRGCKSMQRHNLSETGLCVHEKPT
ncbi:glycine-rich cell wall structural protein-like [Nematolebias whitei]|uniref:glycine-rich cell wall structural protein-like n=1 Tax=Nematolebias whitei TaxID=451745 RepID=UPI00189BA5E7|nr:glycine-rich cell wall structural protein-like [Nematolebias whitei]